MQPKDWRRQAEALFFNDGKTIVEISYAISVSTVSLSKYFNSLPHYNAEKARRKEQNKNRTEYYRKHKQASRQYDRYSVVSKETIKNEQRLAAFILSKERFFK